MRRARGGRRSLQLRTLTGNWIAETPSGSVVWRVLAQDARPVVVTLDRTVTLSAATAELRRFVVDLEQLALGERYKVPVQRTAQPFS